MPRHYERTTSRASYSQKDLQTTIEKVRNNELSNHAASKMYGIPTSTLNDRVRKKTGTISSTLGRPPVIPPILEAELASCIHTLDKWRWGLSREEVLEISAEFIRKNKLKTPFADGKPGADWFISFSKRHNLSIKKENNQHNTLKETLQQVKTKSTKIKQKSKNYLSSSVVQDKSDVMDSNITSDFRKIEQIKRKVKTDSKSNKKKKLRTGSTMDEEIISLHTDSDKCDIVLLEDEDENVIMLSNPYEEIDDDFEINKIAKQSLIKKE